MELPRALRRASPLAWAVGLLFVLDAALRLGAFPLFAQLRGPLGSYAQTEHLLRSQPPAPATIVLAGTSRMRDAVAPGALAAALGLTPQEVLNLGVSAGRPSDAAELYERLSARTAAARLVVIAVEDWQFNAAWPGFPDLRFRSRAGLGDRLAYPDTRHRADLVLGAIWRLWDLRYDLRARVSDVTHLRDPRVGQVGFDRLGRVQSVGRAADDPVGGSVSGPEADPGFARAFLSSYTFWAYEADQLVGLSKAAKANGARVLVLRLPLRPSYAAAVEAEHAVAERGWHGELHRRGVELLDLRDSARFGLAPDDWLDYGHLTAAGSLRFTEMFAAILRPYLDG